MDEAQAPSQISGGARCALHYGQPFTAVCTRCGTYMCQMCTEGGQFTVCPSCRSRTGVGSFPLRRDAFTWGQLTRFAWDVYKRNWALLLVAMIVTFFALALLQGLSAVVQFGLSDDLSLVMILQGILVIPQVLLQSWLTLGLIAIAVKLTRGEPASLGTLFGEWRKLGSLLVQTLIFLAAMIPVGGLFAVLFGISMFSGGDGSDIGLGAIALAVPVITILAVYVGLGAAFASMELVAQPNVGAIDGIRNSFRIARGQRLAILLGGLIGMGAIFLGMIACFVGMVFAYGFVLILFATVYLTLRNGAEGMLA